MVKDKTIQFWNTKTFKKVLRCATQYQKLLKSYINNHPPPTFFSTFHVRIVLELIPALLFSLKSKYPLNYGYRKNCIDDVDHIYIEEVNGPDHFAWSKPVRVVCMRYAFLPQLRNQSTICGRSSPNHRADSGKPDIEPLSFLQHYQLQEDNQTM